MACPRYQLHGVENWFDVEAQFYKGLSKGREISKLLATALPTDNIVAFSSEV